MVRQSTLRKEFLQKRDLLINSVEEVLGAMLVKQLPDQKPSTIVKLPPDKRALVIQYLATIILREASVKKEDVTDGAP